MSRRRLPSQFEKLIFLIKGTEASIVELLVTVGPWLAPLTPAYMTWNHVVNNLGFLPLFGWTTAAAVEILGLASGHTIAKFYMHNRSERARGRRLPLWPILFTFVFYLVVVMTINLAMDWSTTTVSTKMAKVGLILLSVPAIVIVSVRAQHARLLMEKENPWWDDSEAPNIVVVDEATSGNGHNPDAMPVLRAYLAEHGLTPEEVSRGGQVTPSELAIALNLNPTTVRTGLYRLRQERSS